MSLEYIEGIQEKVTRNEVINQLKVALAGEFNASHNLGMQSRMIEGFQKDDIRKQLWKMHKLESEHVQLLVGRIIEMGGNPDIRPMDWDRLAQCDYYPITHTDQKDILEDVYNSKRCKTEFYGKLLLFLQSRDKTTYDVINKIMEQEYEGLENLRKLRDDLIPESEKIQVPSLDGVDGQLERGM